MIWFVLFIIALLSSIIQLVYSQTLMFSVNTLEILLQNLFIYSVGVSGFIGFYGHAFIGDKIAKEIGWKPGSPFQYEVAIMNLALGVSGILCIWFNGYFWLATAIFSSTIMLGCGVGHLRDLMRNSNNAPYNAGFGIWFQTAFLPILLLGLTISYLILIK